MLWGRSILRYVLNLWVKTWREKQTTTLTIKRQTHIHTHIVTEWELNPHKSCEWITTQSVLWQGSRAAIQRYGNMVCVILICHVSIHASAWSLWFAVFQQLQSAPNAPKGEKSFQVWHAFAEDRRYPLRDWAMRGWRWPRQVRYSAQFGGGPKFGVYKVAAIYIYWVSIVSRLSLLCVGTCRHKKELRRWWFYHGDSLTMKQTN